MKFKNIDIANVEQLVPRWMVNPIGKQAIQVSELVGAPAHKVKGVLEGKIYGRVQ